MRSTLWLIVIMLAGWGVCQAENLKGAHEISWSAQFGYVNSKAEHHYASGTFQSAHHDEAKYLYFLLAMRFGTFVTNHIEVEPEVNWMKVQDAASALNISGNVEYNFKAARPTGEYRNIPFLLAGYGIGNATPYSLVVYIRSSDKFDVPVLNLGAGLKTFISDEIALRLEYRYQRFSWDWSYGSSRVKYLDQYHRVLFGISLFNPVEARSRAPESDRPPVSLPPEKEKSRRDREMGE